MIKKYSRLFVAFLKASFVADLEYRANFVTRIITDIIWYAAQIITFEGLFLVTDRIGAWNLDQTRVFLGMLFFVDAFYMILFSENLDHLAQRVAKGDLDLLLTKPVNSQFMISLQRVNTAIVGNLIIALCWLGFSLYNLGDFNWLRLLWLIFLVPTGVASLYSLRFMFGGLTVIFTRAENMQYLFFQIYRLGMRPDSIYSPWLKFTLMTVLPVGIIASVPSSALLEPANPLVLLWTIIWSICLIFLSGRFWKFCLRFYTSASS